MKVAIIGCGIMGSSMAAWFSDCGAEVYAVDVWKEHVDAINEKGLIIEHHITKEQKLYTNIKAFTSPDQIGEIVDLILILVKSPHSRVACRSAQCIADDHTLVMTLQNGLGHADVLAEFFPRENVMYGCMMVSGKIKGPGYVMRKTDEKSYVACGSAAKIITPAMKQMVEDLSAAGLKIVFSEEIDREIYIKAILNCVGNPLSGITRLAAGRLLNDENTDTGLKLGREIEKEIVAVAQAEGVRLETGHLKPAPTTNVHLPSMGQDMRAHKPTEIDCLNGAIVALGKKHGIPTPYNEVVTLIVKTMEANYQYQWEFWGDQ